jgi:hypothetical protein
MTGIHSTCIRADAEHHRVFVGTVEGFHYLDIPTGVWTERDWEGWIGRQVYAIAGHPTLAQRVLTARENAFFKGYIELSDDLGATEHIVYNSGAGSVVDIENSTMDAEEFYACTWPDVVRGEFIRSRDGGATWTRLAPTHHYAMTTIAVDVAGTVFLGGDARVTRSVNGGDTWQPAWNGLPLGHTVSCLAADPVGETMPVGHVFAGNDLGLYETIDGGEQWDAILDVGVRRVAMLQWSLGLPIVTRPAVVTTDGRLLLLRELPDHWTDETGGLAGLQPIDLAFDPTASMLYVLTAQAGVFRAEYGMADAPDPGPRPALLRAGPNPFLPETRLAFTLAEAGPATLEVFDATGRRVASLCAGWQASGRHEVAWSPGTAPGGVYFARLQLSGGMEALPLLRLK